MLFGNPKMTNDCKHLEIVGKIGSPPDYWYVEGQGLIKLEGYECLECGQEMEPLWEPKET